MFTATLCRQGFIFSVCVLRKPFAFLINIIYTYIFTECSNFFSSVVGCSTGQISIFFNLPLYLLAVVQGSFLINACFVFIGHPHFCSRLLIPIFQSGENMRGFKTMSLLPTSTGENFRFQTIHQMPLNNIYAVLCENC